MRYTVLTVLLALSLAGCASSQSQMKKSSSEVPAPEQGTTVQALEATPAPAATPRPMATKAPSPRPTAKPTPKPTAKPAARR